MLFTLKLALEGDLTRIVGLESVVRCESVSPSSSKCQEITGGSVESLCTTTASDGMSKYARKCSPRTLLYGLQTFPFWKKFQPSVPAVDEWPQLTINFKSLLNVNLNTLSIRCNSSSDSLILYDMETRIVNIAFGNKDRGSWNCRI
jgi:hypothetical protein